MPSTPAGGFFKYSAPGLQRGIREVEVCARCMDTRGEEDLSSPKGSWRTPDTSENKGLSTHTRASSHTLHTLISRQSRSQSGHLRRIVPAAVLTVSQPSLHRDPPQIGRASIRRSSRRLSPTGTYS